MTIVVDEPSKEPFHNTADPLEYADSLETSHLNTLFAYQRLLNRFMEENMVPGGAEFCIIMVGSDGKMERHFQSKTELVIINRDKAKFPLAEKLKDYFERADVAKKVEEEVLGYEFGLAHHNLPEEVDLASPDPISRAFGDDSLIFPDRIINTAFIAGSRDVYDDARQRAFDEIVDPTNVHSKRIRDALRLQLKKARQANYRGEYRKQVVWDENYQYYLETTEQDFTQNRFGFKMGPIRTVQRGLDNLTQYLRVDFDTRELPTSTLNRIRMFAREGLLDISADSLAKSLSKVVEIEIDQRGLLEVVRTWDSRKGMGQNLFAEELKEAYAWFLMEYHKVQEVFKENKDKRGIVDLVALPYDREEFLRHMKVIQIFSYYQYEKPKVS